MVFYLFGQVKIPWEGFGSSLWCCAFTVMLLGVTLLRKKYPPAKYLCVLLIVAGVALFLYKPKKGAGSDDHVFGYGELLLVSAANAQITRQGWVGTSGYNSDKAVSFVPQVYPEADVETLPQEDTWGWGVRSQAAAWDQCTSTRASLLAYILTWRNCYLIGDWDVKKGGECSRFSP